MKVSVGSVDSFLGEEEEEPPAREERSVSAQTLNGRANSGKIEMLNIKDQKEEDVCFDY